MPAHRDKFTTQRDEFVDIYRVGDVVRFEVHTQMGTVMWDFVLEDAARIGAAISKAASLPVPVRYCGGDRCTGLRNIRCDDPKHKGGLEILGRPIPYHDFNAGIVPHLDCCQCGQPQAHPIHRTPSAPEKTE